MKQRIRELIAHKGPRPIRHHWGPSEAKAISATDGVTSKLDELLIPGSSGSRFAGNDFRLMCGPAVYCLVNSQGVPLYIGMSRHGISRLNFNHKQATLALGYCEEVFLFPARSLSAARELENLLISIYLPEYNTYTPRSGVVKAADSLGITLGAAMKMRRNLRGSVGLRRAVTPPVPSAECTP